VFSVGYQYPFLSITYIISLNKKELNEVGMKWLDRILGPDEIFSLEDRTLNAILFSSATFSLLAFISDTILLPGLEFIIFSSSLSLILIFLYILGRKAPNSNYLVSIYLIIFILSIITIWHLTGGIMGHTMLYFLALVFLTPIFVHGKKRILVISGIFALMLGLFLAELYNPNLVSSVYADKKTELVDTFITGIFLSIVAGIAMILVLYNDEKQKIKTEHLSKTKEKFFSIISHDLRNPLASMTHLSQMLLDQHQELEPDYRQEFIRHIYNSSNETYNLLENLLEWAKAESNEFSINPEDINLASCVQESSRVLLENIRQKDITLSVNVSDQHFVLTDKNMLMTILRNLLTNAIKFTEKGGLISISSCYEGTDKVQLMISDTGIGIEQNKLEHLMKDKPVESRKGTNNELGSGLGLGLCKEFITKNNGELRFESAVNQGSTFYVTLPMGSNEELVGMAASV
jgi:signal transduction histidine kinase